MLSYNDYCRDPIVHDFQFLYDIVRVYGTVRSENVMYTYDIINYYFVNTQIYSATNNTWDCSNQKVKILRAA